MAFFKRETAPAERHEVEKPEDEWRRELSPEQFRVLRQHGTERPGTSPLNVEKRPGTFLCHNHCIWGAAPLVDALVDVRAFLDANPREVVTLIVQDAITTEDTVDAFEAAGLTPYLHAHRDGEPWATLGELVDRGERLVVFCGGDFVGEERGVRRLPHVAAQ